LTDRHSEALFEFLWCPVCGQEVFTHIPFEGVFCKNCNTQVELQESRETRGYEDAVLASSILPPPGTSTSMRNCAATCLMGQRA